MLEAVVEATVQEHRQVDQEVQPQVEVAQVHQDQLMDHLAQLTLAVAVVAEATGMVLIIQVDLEDLE
jgi:hypothetical protein